MASGVPALRRALLLPLIGLAHAAGIVALIQPVARAATPVPAAIEVSAIPAPVVSPEIAPAPVVRDIAAIIAAPEYEIASEAEATAPGSCALAANVQAALQRDARAQAAVARIPREARSVSNALLLWDGAWAAPASVGGAATLGPIRATVEAEVRAAPEACRQAAVTGPRLIIVGGGAVPVVLAFGSGQWRWDTLL